MVMFKLILFQLVLFAGVVFVKGDSIYINIGNKDTCGSFTFKSSNSFSTKLEFSNGVKLAISTHGYGMGTEDGTSYCLVFLDDVIENSNVGYKYSDTLKKEYFVRPNDALYFSITLNNNDVNFKNIQTFPDSLFPADTVHDQVGINNLTRYTGIPIIRTYYNGMMPICYCENHNGFNNIAYIKKKDKSGKVTNLAVQIPYYETAIIDPMNSEIPKSIILYWAADGDGNGLFSEQTIVNTISSQRAKHEIFSLKQNNKKIFLKFNTQNGYYLSVFNQKGQTVLFQPWSFQSVFNLNTLSTGKYIVRIKNSSETMCGLICIKK